MRKTILFTLLLAISVGCSKLGSFDDVDYYKGYDEVNYSGDSQLINYFILKFDNGTVKFMEAYYDKSSSKKWSEKKFLLGGNTMLNNPNYSEKTTGSYSREGDVLTFSGLGGKNAVGCRIEFTHAEIRGEKAGTYNLDVYYKAEKITGSKSGKINFIGMRY